MLVSGFRAMWVWVLFDLPVRTKPQRKRATEFRKHLLEDGFQMMQYSVYIRPCPSEENAEVHVQRARNALPALGSIRILQITDKQFGRMQCFDGKRPQEPEGMPRQLENI
ncbi:MAG TPA: CRISPR-associated endonuclease Cas2, partial [Planctomycetota bacterium]|nr:CRISPR-associated endonuclease Cas2 [Planctomycetota bacterium]